MSVVRWFLVGQPFPLFPQNKIQDNQIQIYSMKILLIVFKNQTVIKDIKERERERTKWRKAIHNKKKQ